MLPSHGALAPSGWARIPGDSSRGEDRRTRSPPPPTPHRGGASPLRLRGFRLPTHLVEGSRSSPKPRLRGAAGCGKWYALLAPGREAKIGQRRGSLRRCCCGSGKISTTRQNLVGQVPARSRTRWIAPTPLAAPTSETPAPGVPNMRTKNEVQQYAEFDHLNQG